MKLTCHRAALYEAFQVVDGVVPVRTPKEILQYVKMTAADTGVTLIGTDQEVGIRYRVVEAEVQSPGEALLPSKRVLSILRELQHQSVDLELHDDLMRITSGQSTFELAVAEAAEFPDVAEFAEETYFTIDGAALTEAIGRTVFATDPETTRYALGGVLFDWESQPAALVATDSRRLSLAKLSCQKQGDGTPENPRPVIPATAMKLIERSVGDDEDVFLSIHANHALIKSGPSTIYCRLVEGRFPVYGDVIPTDWNVHIDLVCGPFFSVIRQAQIVMNSESRGVDFHLKPGSLVLTSQGANVGQSTIELPVAYDGAEMTIIFDPRYIAEFLRTLESEAPIRLHLIDGENPAMLTADENYTYIVMPLAQQS